jgi:hypothetical protein
LALFSSGRIRWRVRPFFSSKKPAIRPVLRLVRRSFSRFDKPLDWRGTLSRFDKLKALSQSRGEGRKLAWPSVALAKYKAKEDFRK